MRILAMFDTVTGEIVNRTLMHEGNEVREFYSQLLPHPVLVGIEAIGPIQWFLDLLQELGIECQGGGCHKIRPAEPRKQKHDRRDAELILKLLVEKRFPAIWMPSKEQLDLRALLLHRHHLVRLPTQIQNEFAPPDKKRPVVVLTRDSAVPYLSSVTVAPITTAIRGVPSEVLLTENDGMKTHCAVNLHNVVTVTQHRLGRRVAQLSSLRMAEICAAVRFSLGCDGG